MTYKKFNEWCNIRACDGCWSAKTAMFCIEIVRIVKQQPFWKREKTWQKLNAEYSIEEIVIKPINQKITEMYGVKMDG